MIGWTIFAQTNLQQLGAYLKTMFGIGQAVFVDSDFLYFASTNAVLLAALVICSIDFCAFRNRRLPEKERSTVYEAVEKSKGWTIVKPVIMLVLLVVSFAFLVGDSYNPFLYFRF